MAMTAEEKETIILLFGIGLAYALKNKALDVETSEKLLFSPRTQAELAKHLSNQDLKDLIHLGTELEDVQSLLPDKLDESVQEIINKAMGLLTLQPPIHEERVDWYDDLLK